MDGLSLPNKRVDISFQFNQVRLGASVHVDALVRNIRAVRRLCWVRPQKFWTHLGAPQPNQLIEVEYIYLFNIYYLALIAASSADFTHTVFTCMLFVGEVIIGLNLENAESHQTEKGIIFTLEKKMQNSSRKAKEHVSHVGFSLFLSPFRWIVFGLHFYHYNYLRLYD